ncbi:MAG TPA: hypothetical protein VKN18_31525 [Blastocatellia bacterium]|nr:hypothetical protein [Blastocatellia bacterium]
MGFDRSQTFGKFERHLAGGRVAAAIEEYRKIVSSDPTDLTALNTLGDLYVRVGLPSEAKRIFWRVARGYHQLGFTTKTIAVFKKLLRMDRTDSDSALRLAECYLSQGLRSEAGLHFADVARASEQSGREDQAFAAYQRLAELDPSNPALLMKLGERWLTYGLTQRAYDAFSAAGHEYSAQGDEEQAQNAYLKAQALRPAGDKTPAALSEFSVARTQVVDDIPMLIDLPACTFNKLGQERIIGSEYPAAGFSGEASDAIETMLTLSSADENLPDNRRCSERISALVPIVVISESGGWREFTQTLDVSDGGLKFNLAHAVPPLTVLRVSVNPRKWPSHVSNTWVVNDNEGIVRYCNKRHGQPSIVGFDLVRSPE